MNGDGRILAAEQGWLDFAKAQGLGLVGVSFSSPPALLYGNPAKGYYYPEQGSGEALNAGLKKIYSKDLKILLYGFSGGAQFGSRFAELYPERMIGWAAYSASFWKAPDSASPSTAPGIVACGEFDAERYGPSFAYFQQGRRKDARWTWVSIGNVGHMRHKRFEEFVRAYFAAVLEGKFDHAQWLDAETKQPTTEDERLLNPALSAWLPTPEVADLWLKLHHP
jgi:pimeloyl-ACP methyl ester carboxylesterase